MSEDRSATVTFVRRTQVLSVETTGDGFGTVRTSRAGIDCTSSCRAGLPYGVTVVLRAAADRGSVFTGWGDDCSGTGPCRVRMTTGHSVTAGFVRVTHALTVDTRGDGSGTVTSSLSGIDCSSACRTSFVDGATVVLTAAASLGSAFEGWGGDCSGQKSCCSGSGACIVTMSRARLVTARFEAEYRQLAVSKSGNGRGAVTSNAAGIDCGSQCSASYRLDSVVTLTPSAEPGSTFAGWGGACTKAAGACRVTMDADRSVSARFDMPSSVCPSLAGPAQPPQVALNFTLAGHTGLSGCELGGDTVPRGMNAAAALYHAGGKTYVYVGNRTDASDRCADGGSGCVHPHPGILVVDATDPAQPGVVAEIAPPLDADGRPEGLSSRELHVWPGKRLLIVMSIPCGARLEACAAAEPSEPGEPDPRHPASIAFYDLSDPVRPVLLWVYTPRSAAGEALAPSQMSLWLDPKDDDRALLWLSTPTLSVDPGRPNMTIVDISGVPRRDPGAEVVEVGEGNWNGLPPHADDPDHYDRHLFVDSAIPTADGHLTYLAWRRGGFWSSTPRRSRKARCLEARSSP